MKTDYYLGFPRRKLRQYEKLNDGVVLGIMIIFDKNQTLERINVWIGSSRNTRENGPCIHFKYKRK